MLINKLNDIVNTTYTNDIYHVICTYIKDNIFNIPNMSIDEVAEGCFVSKSMISKFTKKIGYETFKDFKYACEEYINVLNEKQLIMSYHDSDLRGHVVETMDSITNAVRSVINDIDYKMLERLIRDVHKSQQIIAIGHGASKNICESLQFYFDYIGKTVIVSDSDFTRENLVDENTLILVISVNGNILKYDRQLIRRVNRLNQKKWLITSDKECSEMENVLVIPSEDKSINDMLMLFLIKIIANHLSYKKSKVYKI